MKVYVIMNILWYDVILLCTVDDDIGGLWSWSIQLEVNSLDSEETKWSDRWNLANKKGEICDCY